MGRLKALLVAQFFGAFNDNAWKMLVIVLAGRALDPVTGRAVADDEGAYQAQTMLAMAVLLVPLIVCSLPGGALADRVSKRTLIVGLKALETGLLFTGMAALALFPGSTFWPLVILACMGLQSALFSPAKYGILPELVPHDRLSLANGHLELWTFLAMILGTALGPQILGWAGSGPWIAGLVLGALSLVGLVAARGIPAVPAAGRAEPLTTTIRETWAVLRNDRPLWLAVVGSTWFWAIASLLGQDVMVFCRSVLGLAEETTGYPVAVFGIGVGLGSWLAGRLSEAKVEIGLVPLGAIGLGGFTLLLGVAPPSVPLTYFVMAVLGTSSGLLIVPLNALLQWRAPPARRGSVIAMSNVLVFTGMLAGSLLAWRMALAGVSSQGILVGAALLTLLGTAWAVWLLPSALLRLLAFLWTHLVYRLHIVGREHVPATGGVLLAPNHVSWMDGLLLSASLDRPVRFLVDAPQYERPLVGRLLKVVGAIPISSTGGTRMLLAALREAGRHLDEGRIVCIFPEGQITRTGTLQPFRRGIERIAKGRAAPIVPVHLDRLWGSIFSFKGGRFLRKLPEQLPYPVTISFGAPLPADTPPAELRAAVQALGESAWYERKRDRAPLHRTFVATVRRRPWRLCVADASRPRVSRLAALAGAVALARALRGHWGGAERVGILLPSSVGGALVNVAASLAGKAAVNLNFTVGAAGMASAVRQAGLRSVVTSRAFLEAAAIAPPEGVELIDVQELLGTIGRRDKLFATLLALAAPCRSIERACGARRAVSVDHVADVIFSSGSTGEPKGVLLTHFNLDSNVEAVAQVFRLGSHDRLLGILPLFHSFGTMSLWFGLNHGAAIVFHPSPLDAPAVGRLVLRYGVTLLLATPTFLSIYLRRCTPEEFGSLRVVLTGAEKLQPALADAFEDRFGLRPLEGYGATECSPVIATSVPSFRARGFFQAGNKRGFVGLPVPGMSVRVVDPDSGEPRGPLEPGRLLVRGPNVMLGYLGRDDLTAQVLRDGWYDTGDIALLDDDGFVKITDRLSRFSKIGGEMVPHGRVEQALHEAWDRGAEQVFAVTAVPDEKKGERLAVLTTVSLDELPELLDKLARAGLPNLYLPRKDAFIAVDEIPKLGTGKTDLAALKRLAIEALTSC